MTSHASSTAFRSSASSCWAYQGGAISIKYAARHPERVSHLIIHGAYARGFLHRGNPDKQRQFVALNRALIREG